MSPFARSYEEACRLYRWRPPPQLNAAVEAVDRQASGVADGHRTALVAEDAAGLATRYSFIDLVRYSNRLANLLTVRGIEPGERVALLFGPSGEAAIALLAILKLGAVAVPLPLDIPPLALRRRLEQLDIRAVLGDRRWARALSRFRDLLPDLRLALVAGSQAPGVGEMWTALIPCSDDFPPAETAPDDPAFLFHETASFQPHDGSYAGRVLVYGHQAVRARLSGLDFAHQGFPQPGDLLWTPADWAGEGGWLDAVLPAWELGATVAAVSERGSGMSGLVPRLGIRNIQLSSRHLPLLGVVLGNGGGNGAAGLRSLILSGSLSAADESWLRDRVTGRVTVLRGAGQPLLSHLLAPSPLFDCPPGALGRPPPGYAVDVINRRGRVLPAGTVGKLAVNLHSPLLPLSSSESEPLPHLGSWMPLDQWASKDLDGTFWPGQPPAEEMAPAPETAPSQKGAAPGAKPSRPLRLTAPDPDERWR